MDEKIVWLGIVLKNIAISCLPFPDIFFSRKRKILTFISSLTANLFFLFSTKVKFLQPTFRCLFFSRF